MRIMFVEIFFPTFGWEIRPGSSRKQNKSHKYACEWHICVWMYRVHASTPHKNQPSISRNIPHALHKMRMCLRACVFVESEKPEGENLNFLWRFSGFHEWNPCRENAWGGGGCQMDMMYDAYRANFTLYKRETCTPNCSVDDVRYPLTLPSCEWHLCSRLLLLLLLNLLANQVSSAYMHDACDKLSGKWTVTSTFY